jgi:hypothetical protein
MATVSLLDVLAAPNLCGVIQGTTTGIPNVFPAGFYQVDQTVDKDTGTYFRVTGTRSTARAVAYGSPSLARQLRNVEEVPFKLIHVAENVNFPMAKFRNLLDKGTLNIDEKGVREITRQVREARKNVDNLRVAALTQMLFNGQIYFDGQGNLLPSSTNARTVVDFAVPSGNKAQLNWDGNGAILSAGWETNSTDIATQIITLRRAAERLTGYELKHAFYGKNVPNYLINNTTLQGYFIRNQESNGQFLRTADIPSPLLGLSWHPAYSAFFEDANGVNQGLVGDDQVVFTPEPDNDWIGWLEGTVDVPGSVTVAADATAALDNIQTASGMFAYGTITTDPVAIKLVYGDTFLPVLKVPKAIFIATVNF